MKQQIVKIIKTIVSVIGHVSLAACVCVFLIFAIIWSLGSVSADEMLFKFKNPSFSGNAISSHYLTKKTNNLIVTKQSKKRLKRIKKNWQEIPTTRH